MVRAQLRSLRDSLVWDFRELRRVVRKLHPSNRSERGYTHRRSGDTTEASKFYDQCNSFRAGPEYGVTLVYEGRSFEDNHTLQEELDRYLADHKIQGKANHCPTNTAPEELDHYLADHTVQEHTDHYYTNPVPEEPTHRLMKNTHKGLDHYLAEETVQGKLDHHHTNTALEGPVHRRAKNVHEELDRYLADDTVQGKPDHSYANTIPIGNTHHLIQNFQKPHHGLVNIVQEEPDHCVAHIAQRKLKDCVAVNNKVCFDTTGAEKQLASRYKKHQPLGNAEKDPLKVYIPTNVAGITEPGRALDLFMEKTRSDNERQKYENHRNKKHERRDSKVDMDMIDMNLTDRGSVETVIFSPTPIHIIPRVKYHQLENSAENIAKSSAENSAKDSDYLGVQGVNIRTGRCGSGTWISEDNGWRYIEDKHVAKKPSLMEIVREGLGDWADGDETIRERRHRRSFK
ncbi:hypothetical protein ACMFMG_003611 [Clarireedia jacksonii]